MLRTLLVLKKKNGLMVKERQDVSVLQECARQAWQVRHLGQLPLHSPWKKHHSASPANPTTIHPLYTDAHRKQDRGRGELGYHFLATILAQIRPDLVGTLLQIKLLNK